MRNENLWPHNQFYYYQRASYSEKEFPLEAIYSLCQEKNIWTKDSTITEIPKEPTKGQKLKSLKEEIFIKTGKSFKAQLKMLTVLVPPYL